jgi:beta-phosphoglucomutase
MFEAVIFDWDCTLADARQVIVISFQKALGEINVKISDEFIERRMGIGAAETFREILRSTKTPFEEDLIARLVEKKSGAEIELASQIPIFDGVRELLEALQGKIKVGLASMNNHAVIMHLLKANQLEKYFQTVLTVESVSHSKPNPEIFLKCAQQLGSPPEKSVVVEDSIFGVKAAKAGGMSCIAVTTGVYSEAELEVEKPDLIVQSLKSKEVLKYIFGL